MPVRDDRPAPADQIARLDEAFGFIRRLWDGETITERAVEALGGEVLPALRGSRV